MRQSGRATKSETVRQREQELDRQTDRWTKSQIGIRGNESKTDKRTKSETDIGPRVRHTGRGTVSETDR